MWNALLHARAANGDVEGVRDVVAQMRDRGLSGTWATVRGYAKMATCVVLLGGMQERGKGGGGVVVHNGDVSSLCSSRKLSVSIVTHSAYSTHASISCLSQP